jgi:ribosomal protein L40E
MSAPFVTGDLFYRLPTDHIEPEVITWFLEVVETNPNYIPYLEGRVAQLRRQGRTRYSIYKLIEDFRWDTPREATDKAGRKCSNNLRPITSRYLIARDPSLVKFFRLRPTGLASTKPHTVCSECGTRGPSQAKYCWDCGSQGVV